MSKYSPQDLFFALSAASLLVVSAAGCSTDNVGNVDENGDADNDTMVATCDDDVQNGDESDTDCGGSCDGCVLGSSCGADVDCQSTFCITDECVAPANGCTSATKDGSETDIDCGGSCAKCDAGKSCLGGGDCLSAVCDSSTKICLSPTCQDGVQNGDETGTDSGGTCTTLDLGFVRFVAIGDQGTGSDAQVNVGLSMGTICDSLGGCDFGLLLGDNFYQSGVDAADDALFESHFEIPYSHLGFPFFITLGNHDLGGDGLGVDLDPNKGTYQVEYSQINSQWRMPAKHFRFDFGPIWFVSLNTTDVFFDKAGGQGNDVTSWMSEADGRWKIAFGHHPYVSNGKHGNAGEYDGVPDGFSWLDIPRGRYVQEFMESKICGKFDVYLAGHDHSRQDLGSNCGTEFLVSGAGAKVTTLPGSGSNEFQAATVGFLLVEADATDMTFYFYSESGVLEHTRAISR